MKINDEVLCKESDDVGNKSYYVALVKEIREYGVVVERILTIWNGEYGLSRKINQFIIKEDVVKIL